MIEGSLPDSFTWQGTNQDKINSFLLSEAVKDENFDDFIKGIQTPQKGEEGMQLGKRTKSIRGLKIECWTLPLRRVHAVMYGPDSTRVAKYSISHFHF